MVATLFNLQPGAPPSFVSNPQIITFKDFAVGVAETVTVTLTNAALGFNTCRVMNVE
jgi:hypothetical protein